VGLGARMVLHEGAIPEDPLPRPAIRPYPFEYAGSWLAKDGTSVTVRPIRPEEEPLVARFHGTLSDRTVFLGYFHAMTLSARASHDRLTRVCFNDYDREIALVAEHDDPSAGGRAIAAIARLIKLPGGRDAEFAIVVSDLWQKRGLGRELLARLTGVAKAENVCRLTADIAPSNLQMQRTCAGCGMRLIRDEVDEVVRAMIDL
jgi:acetyltransferase